MKVSLLLACGGKGVRAGLSQNKLLYKVDGATILEKTLSAFYSSGLIDEYVVVVSNEDFSLFRKLIPKEVILVEGGDTRSQSVKNGLSAVSGDIVLVHDGARPFISSKMIKDCIDTANKFGSAIPLVPSPNTLCTKSGEIIENYLGKDEIYQIQTPQGFITKDLIKAYSLSDNKVFNDDGEVYKNYIGQVHSYQGDAKNIKLTYKEDFDKLNNSESVRAGVGFDCHKLVENRKLILGGIEIPHDKGLLGHSDADVLTHAIMDAMLSSVAERDIGYHFPDTDEKYKGANSVKLLKKVIEICKNKGYKIKSLSAVIMAEKPKLLKRIPEITDNLAKVLSISPDFIGLTATTLEGLGFVGREEGICVNASVIMQEI